MDCGKEVLGDTKATVECQPLLWQPQEDAITSTEAREEEDRGSGRKEIRSGGNRQGSTPIGPCGGNGIQKKIVLYGFRKGPNVSGIS